MDEIKKPKRLLSDIPLLSDEALPGQLLVELLGQDRVLVENHRGIREYGKELISIRCRFGAVNVCGRELELLRMSREQLIIRGQIDAITLNRRSIP